MDAQDQKQPASRMNAAKPHRVLDPRTLGRPAHLMDGFAAQIREDLAETFRIRLNRRYRAAFEVGAAVLARSTERPSQRLLVYRGTAGCIGFAITRELVLCIQRYRYGIRDDEPLEPETASEERLAAMLGAQFVSAVVQRIEALQPAAEHSGGIELVENPASFTATNGWTLRVDIAEAARNVAGSLWFLLEEPWVSRLLQGLTPTRERAGPQMKAGAAQAQPLPARLRLTLTARLLEKELPLGVLLDTRVGDVIPVSLPRTDVLVGDSRLFTASVAEHKGKLCLTSFEDVE